MLRETLGALSRTFGKGLVAVLPLAVTLYVLYWLGAIFERALGSALQWALPEAWYVPGMGLALAVAGLFFIGTALNAWIIRSLYNWLDDLIDRIPLVKSLYGAVRDLLVFVGQSQDDQSQQVVVASLGEGSERVRLLGFVTRERFETLPEGLGDAHEIAVYFPMSYQIGGYTLMLPRERIQTIDMSTEQALRFALTAGMSVERGTAAAPAERPRDETPPNAGA